MTLEIVKKIEDVQKSLQSIVELLILRQEEANKITKQDIPDNYLGACDFQKKFTFPSRSTVNRFIKSNPEFFKNHYIYVGKDLYVDSYRFFQFIMSDLCKSVKIKRNFDIAKVHIDELKQIDNKLTEENFPEPIRGEYGV